MSFHYFRQKQPPKQRDRYCTAGCLYSAAGCTHPDALEDWGEGSVQGWRTLQGLDDTSLGRRDELYQPQVGCPGFQARSGGRRG